MTQLSGGSGKASFYSVVPWQLYASAHQLPWGFDISGALRTQGGVYPVARLSGARRHELGLATTRSTRDLRHLWNVDLRLARR